MSRSWTVQLGAQAEQDFAEILQWTARTFGPGQAQTYAESLMLAIEALHEGPDIVGVARHGRKGRHVVVFRVSGKQLIQVLRLLHDSMDMPKHLSE